MRTLIDIARHDLHLFFSERGSWISLLIQSLVVAYVVGLANGAGATGSSQSVLLLVDVIDHDQSALSQELLAGIRAGNANIYLCPLDETQDSNECGLNGAPLDDAYATTRLEDKTSLALVVIPSGFADTLNAGETVEIVYRSNENASAPSYILQAVQASVQRVSGALVAERVGLEVAADIAFLEFSDDADRTAFAESIYTQASTIWAENPIRVSTVMAAAESTEQNSTGEGFSQSIPGIGTMYVMFAVFPAAAAFITERKNWTLQRLVVMPVSRSQILGGKMLARFAIGMMQYAVMFGFGVFLGAQYGSNPLAIVLTMVAFSLCINALTLAVTTLLRTPGQAAGITLFMTLTLAPLGGAWWPLEIVPSWMQVAGHISPVAWAMDAFRSVIFYNGGLTTVIGPVLVLLAMTAVFFAFGVWRFRYE